MRSFSTWLHWAKHRPTVIINLIGISILVFGAIGWFVYQQNRSIDVLKDWEIAVSSPKETREVDGVTVAVYHPNESLVFTSKSVKLIDAEGVTTRTIVCEETATQSAREIQLDTIPATRPVGSVPKRENAITVPDVAQFAGLPRWCKLVIDVTYRDVSGTGRTQTEHAETERFLVEEAKLDTEGLLLKIQSLQDQIEELKAQLPSNGGSATSVEDTPTAPTSSTPTTSSNGGSSASAPATLPSTPAPQPPVDDRSALGRLPLVGGLLDAIGL